MRLIRLRTYLLRTQWPLWGVLLLLGALSVGTTLWSAQTTGQARKAQNDLREINALLLSVVNMETGVRGYALTREPTYLEPYLQAQSTFDTLLTALRARQSPDDPVAQTRLQQLSRIDTLMNTWFQEVASGGLDRRPGPPQALVALERSGRGKALIDAVRAQVQSYSALETQELHVRQLNAAQAGKLNVWATMLGVASAMVLSFLSSSLTARTLSMKFGRLADAAEHLANTETMQPVGGFHVLEAHRLAQSFNRMAQKLEHSHQELLDRNTRLSAQNQEVTATNALAEHLQTCLSLEEGYRVLNQSLPPLFPGTAGVLAVLNNSRNLLETRVRWGEVGACELVEPQQCWALRRGQVYDSASPQRSVGCTVHAEHPGHACFPLLAQGESLGTFRLLPGEAGGTIPEQAHTLAAALSTQVALGLSNLRLREILRTQSIRDPLTGLFNRRYLDETFEREVRRSERRGLGLAILMLDLDHFKRVNDTFGHEAGDVVLSTLAHTLKALFRREDVVCRFGGEEFLVLLPETSLAQAMMKAEQVRTAVVGLHVTHHDQVIDGLTVSVGVSAFPESGAEPEALKAAADAALYRAKREGRNRVMSAL